MSRCCCVDAYNYRVIECNEPKNRRYFFLGPQPDPLYRYSDIVLDIQGNEACERIGVIGYNSGSGGYYRVHDANDYHIIFQGSYRYDVGGLSGRICIDDAGNTYLCSVNWQTSSPTWPAIDAGSGVIKLDADGDYAGWVSADFNSGFGFSTIIADADGFFANGNYNIAKYNSSLVQQWVQGDNGYQKMAVLRSENVVFGNLVFDATTGTPVGGVDSGQWWRMSENSSKHWRQQYISSWRYSTGDWATDEMNFNTFGFAYTAGAHGLADGGFIAIQDGGSDGEQIRRFNSSGTKLWGWYLGDWKSGVSPVVWSHNYSVTCWYYEPNNELWVGGFNCNAKPHDDPVY
jgi:hypothetical protein